MNIDMYIHANMNHFSGFSGYPKSPATSCSFLVDWNLYCWDDHPKKNPPQF